MMGNVSNATLSEASRLQLLTFINPSLDPLEVGLTRYFGCGADMPLLQSFEDLLNPYQVGLPCVEYFKRKIYTGRVQTVRTVQQPIIQQKQLVSLNVASVNIDIINITTVPHIRQQQHSVLPPLPLIQPQQSNTNQIESVSVTSVNIDITDTATTPQIKQQQHSVLPPLTLIKQLEAHTNPNRAISQCGGKAHKNDDRIAKERGGPLLQPQLSYQPNSVANIDNERGGPLLQPQPSFQPKGAANIAGIFTYKPFMHAGNQSLDTLTHTELCFDGFSFNFTMEIPRTIGFESLVASAVT